MNLFEEGPLEFLKVLNANGVKFIVVGGIAVNYYGYSRSTGDIDLWVDDSTENREKIVAALKEYGIDGAEIFISHPLIAGYSEIMLDNGIYVDLMAALQFFSQGNFYECYQMGMDWQPEENVSIKVLNIKQLIEEKEKSLRPKDKEDAIQLKEIRELLRKGKK